MGPVRRRGPTQLRPHRTNKSTIISEPLEKCAHKMAADSDGVLKAVVICEGDLHDPDFPTKFRSLLGQLKSILDPPKRKKRFLKVDKVRLNSS